MFDMNLWSNVVKYENRKIVSIHFDNLLFALHLSKPFQKWAQKVHFPSTKKLSITNFFLTVSENRVYCDNEPTNYQIWCMLPFITSICHKNKKKIMFSVECFYHLFCTFSRCNAVVSLLKNSNIVLLLLLFPLLINQFAVVCCDLICLAKLVERCCGHGQEKLYS